MKILAIGAHPDDIELYCGGTLLRAIAEGYEVRTIVCSNGESQGVVDNRIQEQKAANGFMGITECYFFGLPDGNLQHNSELIDKIDQVIRYYQPKIVLSHFLDDSHQDHVAVAKSVKSANREWKFGWITYPSYDLRTPFNPNLFVDITDYFDKKAKLLSIFESQKDRWYFSPDVILARSIGTNLAQYVEAFRIEFFPI